MIFYSTFAYLLLILITNFITHPIYSELFIYLSGIFYGLYASLFWPAMHTEIAYNTTSKKAENDLSNMQIITIVVGAIAPIIGGFFIEKISYLALLILSSIILFLGTIPLLKLENIKLKNVSFSFKKYITLKHKYNKSSENVVFKTEGIETTLTIYLFPIFLFIFLENNYLTLGVLTTIFSLAASVLIFFLKAKFNKIPKELLNKRFSKILSLSWGIRSILIIISFPFLIFYEFFHKLAYSFFSISFFSIFYENSKKENYLDYILFREFDLHLTKIIFSLFLIVLIYFYPNINLIYILLISIVCSLLFTKFKER
jgi:hypothetical protein